MEQNTKRIDYIDILKSLTITLVIIGHISFINHETHKYIYSFHMPLFFICYGLTYKSKTYDKKTIKNIILSKLKRLYIPYLLWALLFSNLTTKSLSYILYGSHNSLAQCTNAHLWFFPCFLVSTIMFELINAIFYYFNLNNKQKNLFRSLLIPLSVFISVKLPFFSFYNYPLCFNVAFMGLAFVFIGYFMRSLIEFSDIRNSSLGYLIIFFIIYLFATFTYKLNNVPFVSMATNFYGNVFFFLITAVISSFGMIILSLILDKILFRKIKKFIIFIGQNTLAIIPIHHAIVIFFEKIIPTSFITQHYLFSIAIITISVLIVCNKSIKFINNYIPILNGKEKVINNS